METPPSIGRIVHYILPGGPSAGEERPAIITRVVEGDMVALTAFPDAAHDHVGATFSTPCARHSDNKEPGSWHWPNAL